MSAACKTLQDWKTDGNKLLLLGDMLSLGEWSENFHNILGDEISRSGIDRLITYGSNAELIATSAHKLGMDGGRIGVCSNPQL